MRCCQYGREPDAEMTAWNRQPLVLPGATTERVRAPCPGNEHSPEETEVKPLPVLRASKVNLHRNLDAVWLVSSKIASLSLSIARAASLSAGWLVNPKKETETGPANR